jgi:hypothetical protein
MPVDPKIQVAVDQINNETCSVYQGVALSGLSHTTIRNRIKQDRIRHVSIGGVVRVWIADLDGLR